MEKTTKEAITKSEVLISKSNYHKSLKILDSVYNDIFKQDLEIIQRFTGLYSKVIANIQPSKSMLKKSVCLLRRCYVLTLENHKKPSKKLIFNILQTSESIASIYNKQHKYIISLQYLKRAADIPVFCLESPKMQNVLAKVRISISSIYCEMKKFQDCLMYAKLALENVKNEISLRFPGIKISTMDSERLTKIKSTAIIYILCQLNIAVASSEVSKRPNFQKHFDKAIKYAEVLKEDQLIYTISQKESEVRHKLHSKSSGGTHHVKSSSFMTSSTGGFFASSYYNPEKLQKASIAISSDQKFISTDDFFSQRIRSEMNLRKEIESDQQDKIDHFTERKALSAIRLKKNQKAMTVYDNSISINERLDLLQKESGDLVQKQAVQMRSKLRTRFYKKLITAFNIFSKTKSFPQQRLFFKPPLENLEAYKRSSSKRKSNWVVDKRESSKQREIAKTEIETLLYTLKDDLKPNCGKGCNDRKLCKESSLAKSAQKGLTAKREKFDILRQTISKALSSSRRATKSLSSFQSFLTGKLK